MIVLSKQEAEIRRKLFADDPYAGVLGFIGGEQVIISKTDPVRTGDLNKKCSGCGHKNKKCTCNKRE
jgi:hypothetical protein